MSEDQSRETIEREYVQRAEHGSAPGANTAEMVGEFAPLDTPSYPASLLSNSKPGGRGNRTVRATIMQRMQQTYGNRAVQRFLRLQRSGTQSSAPAEDDIARRIESRAGGGSSLDSGVQRTLEAG